MSKAGVDEAGRGAVIGPLVVSLFFSERIKDYKDLGIKDSKLLSRKKREEIFESFSKKDYLIKKITPKEIDKKNINDLEIEAMRALINKTKAKKIIIDLPTTNKKEFLRKLDVKKQIIAEHKADNKYLEVSCASIVAKVTRDQEIDKIKDIIGDFGSGYPSDEKTIKFLEKNGINRYVRKKWKTVERLLQKKLDL